MDIELNGVDIGEFNKEELDLWLNDMGFTSARATRKLDAVVVDLTYGDQRSHQGRGNSLPQALSNALESFDDVLMKG